MGITRNSQYPSRYSRTLMLSVLGCLLCCATVALLPLAQGANLGPGHEPTVFSAGGDGFRSYVRTIRSNMADSSFQAEVTVTLNGGGGAGCAFFGMGSGEPDAAQFNEPSTAPSLFCRLAPSDFAGGQVTVSGKDIDREDASSPIGDGTHRLRMTWDAAKKRALFEICRNWDGKTFHSDSSATVNVDKLNFGNDGHLFIGGAAGVTFTDFAVKVMSAQAIKATAFGEAFANDPTAGSWFPTSASTHDGIRLLACWYNGAKLIATRAFTNGILQTSNSKWACSVNEKRIATEPDARDLTLTFTLTDGFAKSAGVAVAFDFANWSANNYVLIPAAVYNGNRNRIEHRAYGSGLEREDLYKKDLPLTTSDLPQLSPEPGHPSRIELSTCNTTTPAMCFYNRQTKRAVVLLTEQGISDGDHIRDNGLIVEESPDRTRASFVVSAPGVRDRKPEFIGFSASPDRGMDWKAGDTVRLHVCIYSFETPDIPGLLDRFTSIRKDVTGPNHPRDLIPFSEVIRLMSNRIDSRFYQGSDSQFYCPENAPWISFGWIGGLIDTFPMLALGDAMHRDRVTKTFDFAIPRAQGKAGYFYGALNHDGKVFGREGYDDHPEIVLTRKNGDVLFWMLKQFVLLKDQGMTDAIKPEWEENIKRLANAFVETWKKDGQWGQYINAETGEVAVYNSTGGPITIAGLVFASKYFNDPSFLKVASEAAEYYYQRDVVNLGMTTGNCADILQNADSESAAAFLTSLMALYEATGETSWLLKSKTLANLGATWVVSHDYRLPPQTELGGLNASLAGAVWASTQNKHGAPGFCTLSGDALFKLYRATNDIRYADLLHDVVHAHAEGIRPDGEITERLTYCDADSRGSRGGGSTGWNELNGILMAMELPGIYLRTDSDQLFVFDHVEARQLKRDASGVFLSICNPTKFEAKVTVLAENLKQARQPLSCASFQHWPSVTVKAGQNIQLHILPNGQLAGN